MKNSVQKFKKIGMLLIAIMFFGSVAIGATFTAVASGNWSSMLTWGGTVPSFNNIGDQINIPATFTVTMDNNVTLNGPTASISISALGTLNAMANNTFAVFQGTLTGIGSINADSVVFGTLATMTFAGTFVANTVINTATSITSTATITVNNTLDLVAGNLSVFTGGSLALGSNATINVSGGTLSITGGTFNNTLNYNVNYNTTTATTGAEILGGPTLTNINVNVGNADSVILSNNLILAGILTLQSGTLKLNTHNLIVNGNIAAINTGRIASDSLSSITLHTASTVLGALNFSANDTVKSLTVFVGGLNGNVRVNTNMVIADSLHFIQGNLYIGSDTLQIGILGSITGASTTSYVITSLNGFLGRELIAGAVDSTLFPIGTMAHYYPATVLLAVGSTSGNIMASVDSTVYSQGYINMGQEISMTQPMVNATWFFATDINTVLNLSMSLMWATSSEINGFNNQLAYISHYTSNAWDANATAAANVVGNLWSISRSNLTSLSPFAVFDPSTVTTTVPEVAVAADEIILFPNPSADNITIKSGSITNDATYYEVLDMVGNVLSGDRLKNNDFNVSLNNLSSGIYFIRIYNDKTNVVKKFTKI